MAITRLDQLQMDMVVLRNYVAISDTHFEIIWGNIQLCRANEDTSDPEVAKLIEDAEALYKTRRANGELPQESQALVRIPPKSKKLNDFDILGEEYQKLITTHTSDLTDAQLDDVSKLLELCRPQAKNKRQARQIKRVESTLDRRRKELEDYHAYVATLGKLTLTEDDKRLLRKGKIAADDDSNDTSQ